MTFFHEFCCWCFLKSYKIPEVLELDLNPYYWNINHSFWSVYGMHYSIRWIYGVYLGKGSIHIHWSLKKSWFNETNFGTFFHFMRITSLSIAESHFPRRSIHAKFFTKHAYPLQWTVHLMTLGPVLFPFFVIHIKSITGFLTPAFIQIIFNDHNTWIWNTT